MGRVAGRAKNPEKYQHSSVRSMSHIRIVNGADDRPQAASTLRGCPKTTWLRGLEHNIPQRMGSGCQARDNCAAILQQLRLFFNSTAAISALKRSCAIPIQPIACVESNAGRFVRVGESKLLRRSRAHPPACLMTCATSYKCLENTLASN